MAEAAEERNESDDHQDEGVQGQSEGNSDEDGANLGDDGQTVGDSNESGGDPAGDSAGGDYPEHRGLESFDAVSDNLVLNDAEQGTDTDLASGNEADSLNLELASEAEIIEAWEEKTGVEVMDQDTFDNLQYVNWATENVLEGDEDGLFDEAVTRLQEKGYDNVDLAELGLPTVFENGLNPVAFYSADENKLLVGFGGTNFGTKEDIIADAQLWNGIIPDQFYSAEEVVQTLQHHYTELTGEKPHTSVTGFSLGGGITQWICGRMEIDAALSANTVPAGHVMTQEEIAWASQHNYLLNTEGDMIHEMGKDQELQWSDLESPTTLLGKGIATYGQVVHGWSNVGIPIEFDTQQTSPLSDVLDATYVPYSGYFSPGAMLVDFTSRFSDGTFHHGDPNPDAISLHTAQLGGLAETLTLSAVDKDIARELLDNYAYKPTALDTQPTGTFRIAHSETVQNVLNPPPPPAPLALPEPARIISSLITSWLPLGF